METDFTDLLGWLHNWIFPATKAESHGIDVSWNYDYAWCWYPRMVKA